VLDAVLLRPLPVRNPEGLVQGFHQGKNAGFSYPLFREMSARQNVVQGIFAAYDFPVETAALRDSISLTDVRARLATGGYFRLLGVDAQIGRVFTEQDDTRSAQPVAVISHSFWQRTFAGRSDAIGQTLRINQALATVIGVTPREFFGERTGTAPDVWLPINLAPRVESSNWLEQPGWGLLSPMARLRRDVARDQAQAALNVLYRQLSNIIFNLEATKETRLQLEPGSRGLNDVRERFSRPLWQSCSRNRHCRPSVKSHPPLKISDALPLTAILESKEGQEKMMALVSSAFGGLALLLASVGLYGVVAYGVERRTKELGIRLALGASRQQVIGLLLRELILLVLLGLAIGGAATVALGKWIRALLFGLSPQNPAMLFLSVVSLVVVAVSAGYLAARRAARVDPLDALRCG
jgi:hypothetical protein